MGQLVPLSERHNNLFIHDLETPVLDNATKKPLYPGQKPINLLNDIISLYTCNSLVCYGFNRDRVDQSTKFGTLIPWHI